MDTQNTPVHIRLWNKDFWFLALANTFFTMAVCSQFVTVHEIMAGVGISSDEVGLAMGTFALGLPLLGVFCSYLVQRFRRNHVCVFSMLMAAVCLMLPVFVRTPDISAMTKMMVGVRLATGAFWGLAQMVLVSTLVIDTCEAHQRTEANYAEAWFGRFGWALGPLLTILLMRFYGVAFSAWVAVALVVAAIFLLLMVQCPFRTPEDNVRLFSFDRFFLPGAWALFVNMMMVTVVFGMLLSIQLHSPMFFAYLMLGFLLALIAEKFVFVNAELKSETVSGLILVIFAILLLMSGLQTNPFIVPVLIGLGMGLMGSRFSLFFIKLSQHSKRGTSQSSFFLAWEMGMALGLGWGFSLMDGAHLHISASCGMPVLSMALTLTVLALLFYVIFTHRWYMSHKNR